MAMGPFARLDQAGAHGWAKWWLIVGNLESLPPAPMRIPVSTMKNKKLDFHAAPDLGCSKTLSRPFQNRFPYQFGERIQTNDS